MEKKKEVEKNSVHFREGNISIVLDSYDDIFSDFDPRSYNVKALSDDFIVECKRAALEKKGKLELRFFIPAKKRNYSEEAVIRKRIKEHFHWSSKEKRKERNKIKGLGLMWFIIGTLVIIGGTLLYPYRELNFFYTLMFIVSEPASWFFFWEGLRKIFIDSKDNVPDYDFNHRMSKSEIHFLNY